MSSASPSIFMLWTIIYKQVQSIVSLVAQSENL